MSLSLRFAGKLRSLGGKAVQGAKRGAQSTRELISDNTSKAPFLAASTDPRQRLIGAALVGSGAATIGGSVSNTANEEADQMAANDMSLFVQRASLNKAAKIQEMQLANQAVLARLDPHLYNELLVGRMLAPGDIFIGPDPNPRAAREDMTLALSNTQGAPL